MPIDEHCWLLSRPFPRRPTPKSYDKLIKLGMELQAAGGPDRKALYFTAGKTLHHFPVDVSGYAEYPPLDRK